MKVAISGVLRLTAHVVLAGEGVHESREEPDDVNVDVERGEGVLLRAQLPVVARADHGVGDVDEVEGVRVGEGAHLEGGLPPLLPDEDGEGHGEGEDGEREARRGEHVDVALGEQGVEGQVERYPADEAEQETDAWCAYVVDEILSQSSLSTH